MKLKLLSIIITIALGITAIGLLGGCGGNSNRNTEEPRDETIALWDETTFTSYTYSIVKVDGRNAIVYKDGSAVVGLTISDNISTGHVGKIYLLPSTQNISMILYDITNNVHPDFTATSSNDSIASIDYDKLIGILTTILIKAHAVGTARINITAEDGRKTWTDVIVVDTVADFPAFN